MGHGNASTNGNGRSKVLALTIGAIGVVYGDIGTSPLYALKESFSHHYGLHATPADVLGILSLIFWSLTMIVSLKYLLLVMRFDNKGEGGILALMELVHPRATRKATLTFIFALGIFGAALLYGDGIITPAISVLSAVEGVIVTAPHLQGIVVPTTIVILLGLFVIQRRGTTTVGRIFGPVMTVWFLILGVLGVISIVQDPRVLQAMNPWWGVEFFLHNGFKGFAVLGSVFLAVTGGEALYADMGHFGVKPIRRGWFTLVYYALVLNYFGQGALLLRTNGDPAVVANPFFNLVPEWGVIPLVVMSTLATIIASQAVISGAFSLTWQALQLGYFPRLKVVHTSGDERGQIYIPFINWALFVATVILVVQFKTSSNLAAAYGIAVTATMVITGALTFLAMRRVMGWSLLAAGAFTLVFATIDLSFFGANVLKILDGGWVPLVLGALIYMVMLTWHRGRELLRDAIARRNLSLNELIAEKIDTYKVVEGTALYMSGYAGTAPPALISNIKYNKCRHETIILLTVQVDTVAHIPHDQRIAVERLPKNFYQVVLHYGFMDQLNLMEDLTYLPEYDIPVDITDATFVLGHEVLAVRNNQGMARWRKDFFVFMHRNSRTPSKYFGVPSKRMLEVGSQIEL